MATGTRASSDNSNGPIVVDLGKKKRKDIKRLRKGRGKLLDQVDSCIQELKDAGVVSGPTQPVIVVVAEKPTRGMRWF